MNEIPPLPPGCEAKLERIQGLLVFHVGFGPGGRHAGQRFGLVASDGYLGGFSRDATGRAVEEIVADAIARGDDDERDAVAFSDFGQSPIDARRLPDGTGCGDLAIHLAEEWERRVAAPPGTRLERAHAMQARLMADGLAEAIEEIGRDRMRIHALLLANPLNVLDPNLGCLRMHRASAIRIDEASRAYPALAVGIAGTWRRDGRWQVGGDTPHRTALGYLDQLGVDGIRGRAILRSVSAPGGPAGVRPAALQVLGRVPRDWIPAAGDAAEWEALSLLAPVLLTAADTTGQPIEDLAAHCAGRWRAYAGRLAAAAGVTLATRGDLSFHEVYGELRDAANDLGDMMRDLRNTLAAPLLAWHLAPETSHPEHPPGDLPRLLLFEGRGLARILEDSRRWHRAGGVRIAGRETGSVSWHPVLPPMRHDAVEIVPLASKAALAGEGTRGLDAEGLQGLHHCVATRWPDCLAGRSRVMGVRRIADGTRLSTFEVAFDEAGSPRLKEHRGHANASPPPEAALAVTGYMALLAMGRLAYPKAPLMEGRRRRGAQSVEDLCGYDWRDPELLAEAIEAWSPYLARPYRGLGPAAFLRATTGLGDGADPEPSPAP